MRCSSAKVKKRSFIIQTPPPPPMDSVMKMYRRHYLPSLIWRRHRQPYWIQFSVFSFLLPVFKGENVLNRRWILRSVILRTSNRGSMASRMKCPRSFCFHFPRRKNTPTGFSCCSTARRKVWHILIRGSLNTADATTIWIQMFQNAPGFSIFLN